MAENLRRRFGKRIRYLREKRKWTQDEFADVSGFHRAYIGTVERGETNVTLKNIEIIAKALGVKFVDLFRGLDD